MTPVDAPDWRHHPYEEERRMHRCNNWYLPHISNAGGPWELWSAWGDCLLGVFSTYEDALAEWARRTDRDTR